MSPREVVVPRIVIAALTAVVLALLGVVAVLALDDDGGRHGMVSMMRDSSAASEEDYLVEMVAHHQDAITAAEELARSDRPQMRALGRSIVTSQTAQVEQMEGWLDEWYDDGDDPTYEPMMRDLSDLSGDRLDRAFLADMVPHHMTAVMMSQRLLVRGLAEHDEVADLARTIRDDQREEIALMVRWSRSWFGETWRMGHGWDMGMMR